MLDRPGGFEGGPGGEGDGSELQAEAEGFLHSFHEEDVAGNEIPGDADAAQDEPGVPLGAESPGGD